MEGVLVTGAAGFVGARIVRTLLERGDDVHAVVHPRTDLARLHGLDGPVTIHRADLADVDAVGPVVRGASPAWVVHAAARGGHPTTPAERVASWRDTVLGTVALLESLRDVGIVRFVHVGSSLEYRPADRPLREDDPLEPTTARGATKVAATVAVLQWAQEQGVPATVIRPFSVYGPGEPPGRLIPTLMHCLRTGDRFRTTTGTYRRDLVFVDDVADACALALHSDAAAGATLNVGTGVETSTGEVVELAQRVTGRTISIEDGGFPARPSDTEHWVADMTRTRSLLGWLPPTDLATGLDLTWQATAAVQQVR